MDKISKNRIKLIKGMILAIKKMTPVYSVSEIVRLNDAISYIRNNPFPVYLSLDSNTDMISFSKTKSQAFDEEKRIPTTIGKYFRRHLKVKLCEVTDDTLDKFAEEVKAFILEEKVESKIKVLKGKEIVDEYKNEKVPSCMAGEANYFKVQLYGLNPDKIFLVVYDRARALLWKTDEGQIVLDRIYPSKCHEVSIIRNWATKKGYILRGSADNAIATGSTVELSDGKYYTVTAKHNNIFPYLDTFPFGRPKGTDVVNNSNEVILSNNSKFGFMVLHSTHGKFERIKICCSCGARPGSDSLREYGENRELYCNHCFDKMFFICDCCGDDKRISVNKRVIINTLHVLCSECADIYLRPCKMCSNKFLIEGDDLYIDDKKDSYCWDCYCAHLVKVPDVFKCKKCDSELVEKQITKTTMKIIICERCGSI